MVEDSNSEKLTLREKPRIGIGCTLLLAAACSPAEVGPSVSADVYARAERFLFWHAPQYVINGDIRPHWIGTEDRFWYLRTAASGGEEFVVVEATTGKRAAAFDQRRVAAELSRSTGNPLDPAHLPFASFRYVDRNTAIEFQWGRELWRCRLTYPEFYKVGVSIAGVHDLRGYMAVWGETYNGPLTHNKDFDLLLVPNGNHQIVASPYVIRRKWDYFVRHLLGAQPPAGYAIAPPVTPGR